MIKTGMRFSVQENGSFHVINNGEKVGVIRKNTTDTRWHIDTARNTRFGSFVNSAEARKHASNNHNIF